MMDEIMYEEEQLVLCEIAKLTEGGQITWKCVGYNPIGFLDSDDYSQKPACICQMFQFVSSINTFPYELEFVEYINVPSGEIDICLTLTRDDADHFLKIDSILSAELEHHIEPKPKDVSSMPAVRLVKSLVPIAAKTEVVEEAFEWASFINQMDIPEELLKHPLTILGERLCSEHRALDFHKAVFDNSYRDSLLAKS